MLIFGGKDSTLFGNIQVLAEEKSRLAEIILLVLSILLSLQRRNTTSAILIVITI
jgi:hypothetical protein